MNKILIANRGEIALRIMRSAHEMGIKCVAIYSEADKEAMHVRYADEAYCIGPPPSSQSYLLMDKIIEVAKKSACDAIHPGYGFLSERAEFARKVKQAGLVFIGPSAEAMEMMGSKLSAKQAAKRYNVPLVPGTDEAISDLDKALETAKEIGFPILIKASAGGGGKGMRVVERAEDFEEQMNFAVSEAIASFGDGSVFIERYVASPRHIEIQILADNHGNVVYLFERECSIQRRHQKVVEEAPSCILTPSKRQAMGECAVAIAKACNYSGAGTVEFLVDEQLNFYFLEMNTRLQVEHPVTEYITGLDLVKEQIKVAKNESLSFNQNDIKITGHAIEVRVCAEDPSNNFMPDIGRIVKYSKPSGVGVRVDDGIEEGMEIPIYYDPMIAKLIVFGSDRLDAIAKLTRAIDDYKIIGVETTLPFCRFAINHPAFINGNFDTNFVKKHFKPEFLIQHKTSEEEIVASIVTFLLENNGKNHEFKEHKTLISNWKLRKSFS
jgi:acetyl-CoA carboxylase biotin carboxylase subunit